jgi:hypothetical protein
MIGTRIYRGAYLKTISRRLPHTVSLDQLITLLWFAGLDPDDDLEYLTIWTVEI